MATQTVWQKLAAPFPDAEVKLRPQTIVDANWSKVKPTNGKYPDGCKAKMLEYIDARNVMDRLDEVIGADQWRDRYEVIERDGSGKVLSVECTLTLVVDGTEVVKVDVGYRNNPTGNEDEPAKAAYSDALKRAAVKFGVGRFLYSRPDLGWVPVDKYGKPTRAWLAKYRKGAPVVVETDEQVAEPVSDKLQELRDLKSDLHISDAAYTKSLEDRGVTIDTDLNDEQLDAMLEALRSRKRQKEEA